jgi:hypothetical protein
VVARCVEEAGGCEQLEELQEHGNPAVYQQQAQRLLEKYFGAASDAEDEDDGLGHPALDPGADQFLFGDHAVLVRDLPAAAPRTH